MRCPICNAELPAAAQACPKCTAAAAAIPPGARLVITKAPEGSGSISGYGRTMMDLGPSGAPAQVIFALVKLQMIIGRAPECDIQLNHTTVSKQHARVVFSDGGFVVEDLGSVNGIKVNDAEVEKHRLAPNDQIKVGKFVMTYVGPGAG